MLYELLTGRKPFKGDTMSSLLISIVRDEPAPPSSIEPSLNPQWDAIVKKALAKSREQRYATAKEFGIAVRDAAGR